jgi:hypothetical protein
MFFSWFLTRHFSSAPKLEPKGALSVNYVLVLVRSGDPVAGCSILLLLTVILP